MNHSIQNILNQRQKQMHNVWRTINQNASKCSYNGFAHTGSLSRNGLHTFLGGLQSGTYFFGVLVFLALLRCGGAHFSDGGGGGCWPGLDTVFLEYRSYLTISSSAP